MNIFPYAPVLLELPRWPESANQRSRLCGWAHNLASFTWIPNSRLRSRYVTYQAEIWCLSVGIFAASGSTHDDVLDEELFLEIVANLFGGHDGRLMRRVFSVMTPPQTRRTSKVCASIGGSLGTRGMGMTHGDTPDAGCCILTPWGCSNVRRPECEMRKPFIKA